MIAGASVSRDRRVLIWVLARGAITRLIEGQRDVLSVASFGGKLFTTGDDMTLHVWDIGSGALVQKRGPFETETDTCAVDPLRCRVILGFDDGSLRVFDTGSGDLVAEIAAHASGIKKVAVSPVTGDILSAAYDQRILVWDAIDLRLKVPLEPSLSAWERSFNWSPDGATILAGTFDGTVLEWDAPTGACLREVGEPGGNACFNDISVNDAGEVVAVSDDGRLRLGLLTRSRSEWLNLVELGYRRILMNAVTHDSRSARVVCGAHNHSLHYFEKSGNSIRNGVELCLREGPINGLRVAQHPGYEGQAFVAC